MCAEALTQEEIDALLRSQAGAEEEDSGLADEENEAVSKYAETFREAMTNVWPKLIGQEIQISLSRVESVDTKKLSEQCTPNVVLLSSRHDGDLKGAFQVVFPDDVALGLAGAMTGNQEEFGELEKSAFGEGHGQTMGTLCTQLGQSLKVNTQVSPATVVSCSNSADVFSEEVKKLGDRGVCAFFNLEVGEQSGELLLVFSNELIDRLMDANMKLKEPVPEPSTGPAPSTEQKPAGSPEGGAVRPAVFESFDTAPTSAGRPGNLDLILDIGLDVRVELGRTAMKIKDVLELGPGSVLELDKLAGEPVDLLVNDKLFARGEVVVIDENFGVRVTDIVNVQERIEALRDR